MQHFLKLLAGTAILACSMQAATAQEATIRKNLAERIPQLPKIDEVSTTPITGLYEIRVNGAEIYYTDALGNYLVQGSLFDTRQKRNITEERLEKLSAVSFDSLPLKDAVTMVRGDGKRKLAVFADPNCGYCKRFEKDLMKIDNITVHLFLYPILGADSTEKSKNIWCAKDQGKTWDNWMQKAVAPTVANCDVAALARNVAFGQKYRITGTPTVIFANGKRVPGAISADQIEKNLAQAGG